MIRKFADRILKTLPNNYLLYRISKRYVDKYNGENNHDIRSNGELRFLQEYLINCHTVFDIGANVGEWSNIALNIEPNINLHCFEPSKATFNILQQKKFPPNVVLNNFGCGSSPSEQKLFIFNEGSGLNSLYRRQGLEYLGLTTQKQEEIIHIDTIDNYVKKKNIRAIDFMKVDVEGYELEVFKGMRETLELGLIKIIQFEYGGCNIDARVFLKDIWDFFTSYARGYSFYKIYPDEVRRVTQYRQDLDNFQYQNWAIMRNM